MENKGPLKTFLHNNVKNIQDLLNSSDKNICLWVIDMQNDFIDAPFKDTTLFNNDDYAKAIDVAPGTKLLPEPFKKVEEREKSQWDNAIDNKDSIINKGRFAVNEGIQCVEDVIYYINLLTNKYDKRLNKVIFSRDIHTSTYDTQSEDDNLNYHPNHCSFENYDNKGFIDGIGFPSHCVNGTIGCKLNKDIETLCTKLNEKALVVMKGCSKEYDSFGAFPYDCSKKGKAYSNKRQHNGCKNMCSLDENSIDKNTGSYVLNKPERYNYYINLNLKRDKIKDKIDSIGGDNMIHLVCGLAGDYCVRDTAINLKFAYPNSTVAVIADATRYAALYDSVIVPDFIMEGLERTEFLENTLHLKSFIDNPVPLPTYFLTPPDVMLYTYSNKMLPGEGVIFTMDNERKSNLNYTKPSNSDRPTREPDNPYWCLSRFYYLLGKQKQKCLDKRIECYENAKGFKDNEYNGKRVGRLSLDYPSPVTPSTKGGKRRRRRRRKTKKRHNKKPKRKVTKKRHQKKTKKRKVRKTKKNKTRKR